MTRRTWAYCALAAGFAVAACSSSGDRASAGKGTSAEAGRGGDGGSSVGGGYPGDPGAPGSGGGGFGTGGAGFQGSAGSGGTGIQGSAGSGFQGSAGAPPDSDLDAGDGASDADAEVDRCADLDQTEQKVLFLSNDDSNSMASPVIARGQIESGNRPTQGVIRTYEFLNYYDVGYAPAAAGQVAVYPELGPTEDPGKFDLQIAVVSEPASAQRKPLNLTLVLDTSGSMSGQPIELERETVRAIAKRLLPGDIVSAVTWNTQNAIVLDSHDVDGPDDATVVSMANGLTAGGGTNLNGGLTAGYALAQKNFDPAWLNRVVIVSDGRANAGITDETIIGDAADLNDGDGIYLVGVGVGDGVNDTLMNTVTDAGRGAYVYLDTKAEATRMFVDRFAEVMDVAARSVRVELRMPWYMDIEVFHGEEYSEDPREVEPQHLAPGDGMVFNQLIAACSPDVVTTSDPIEVVVRWQTPLTHEDRQIAHPTTFDDLLADTTARLAKGQAIVAYAEALKDPSTAVEKLDEAIALADDADPGQGDPELNEIRGLIDKARKLY